MHASHKVPTHMSMPDKVVFGLTARQLLILLIGCSASYDLWLQLHALNPYTAVGLIVRVGMAVLPAVAATALALISVAGRSLEVWSLVLFRYWQQPQTYVWRSVRTWQPGGRARSGTTTSLDDDEHEERERMH
jgi:PrgI family protein